jgi:sulfide:quinone oxidoreductase
MDIRPLSPRFAISEQLQPSDLATAAGRGFRAIVCNRPDGEAPEQPSWKTMAAEAERLGLGFVYIPITPGEIADTQARRLSRFLATVNGPALGYCRTGARSEKLWERAMALAASQSRSTP